MPTINASSRKLASDHTFHDLINDKRRRHAHQELLKQEQDSFRNACTFQPKLCEGTRTKVSNNRNNSDISLIHGTLDPALIIDSTRLYRQSQTISTHKTTEDDNECTFSPRISYPRQKLSTQPVLVNGLNRHLQLQTMALQKSQDIEERQRQAFHPDFRKYRDEENRTVIQPFNLTRSQNSSKQK